MASLLHVVDYVIFAAMLAISMGIGVYHALTGGRQRTTAEYIHGNRQMGLVPVTLSMMVTFISTLTMLGYPTEIVAFGAQYWIGAFGVILGVVLATVLFIPIFYPLKITSVNEYLEMRYDSALVKYIGTFMAVGGNILYLGNIFYGPSTAIEAASGFPTWASIVICATVAIIYTCIGGFKAVIWTDVFQSFLMLLGLIVVSIQGLIAIGGFSRMWNIAEEWGRLEFFDFDPDPTIRINFYGAFFGNALTCMGIFGHLQVGVQRYSSLPTINKARMSVLGVIPGNLTIATLASLCGLIAFSYYAHLGCDPKEAGTIRSYNQILPYFVADVLRIPGVPGLFLAALTAATLSSASSCMNSTAANIWADIVKPKYPEMTEQKGATFNKLMVLLFGLLAFGVAIFFDNFGGTMIQIMTTVVSSFAGPCEALFVMGAFIPWVNWKGASVGSLVGFCFSVWMSVGSMTNPKNWQALPAPDNCSSIIMDGTSSVYEGNTFSPITAMGAMSTASAVANLELSGLQKFYSLSFLWFKEVTAGVSIVAALIVSLITGYRRPSTVPFNLVHPWLRKVVTLGHEEATLYPLDKKKKPVSDLVEDDGGVYSHITAL